MLWSLFTAFLLFGARPSQAQVNFFNLTNTAPYQSLSATCISVLNSLIQCDAGILGISMNGPAPADETLTGVCTTTCTSQLTNWVRRAAGACGTTRYTSGEGSYLASYMAQAILEDYSVVCLKNTQGQFCKAVFQTVVSSAAASATQTVSTATLPSSIACHSCLMSMLSTQLQMPIGNMQTYLRAEYASMTSNCQVSNMALTSLAATTTWVSMLPPEPTPTCSGARYTIKAGDTCRSVSFEQGISTTELLLANNLQSHCADFPTSGTLCIPTAKKCKPYQLKVDLSDECASIASDQGIYWVQLVSWNPDLGEFCESLHRLAAAGYVLCVSTPGGDWVNPFPETTSTTTTDEPETYFTLPGTPFASAPTPNFVLPYPNIGYVPPYANDTVLDCALHRTAPVRLPGTNSTADSYECADFASFYGITMSQLVEWNPSLANRTSAGGGSCLLYPGKQYCAQLDFDAGASNMTPACNSTEVAETGPRSDCDGFVHWWGLDKASFVSWNPGVGPSCERFHSGKTYCTSVRGFRPAGAIATCNRWHRVQEAVSGAGACTTIETRYGLQHARFVAWNPTVLSNCSGIKQWYEYCVGTPQFPGLP